MLSATLVLGNILSVEVILENILSVTVVLENLLNVKVVLEQACRFLGLGWWAWFGVFCACSTEPPAQICHGPMGFFSVHPFLGVSRFNGVPCMCSMSYFHK